MTNSAWTASSGPLAHDGGPPAHDKRLVQEGLLMTVSSYFTFNMGSEAEVVAAIGAGTFALEENFAFAATLAICSLTACFCFLTC